MKSDIPLPEAAPDRSEGTAMAASRFSARRRARRDGRRTSRTRTLGHAGVEKEVEAEDVDEPGNRGALPAQGLAPLPTRAGIGT